MASKKNRKLSGVVLTGALVAPAVMSAAQQNVASADLGSLLSSAKKFGSLALKGAGSFFNTMKGQIVAVVAFVGLGYGLFCLLKKGYEYIRDKTTDTKFDDTAQKYQTDKAGYEKFIEKLREAREKNGSLFNLTTEENKDDITINLKKGKISLEIKATFEKNGLKVIEIVDNEDGHTFVVYDNFANKLAEYLNNFFEYAKIPVVAKASVSSKEVADVEKIRFESTGESKKNNKDFEYINKITNDDEKNDDNQAAEVDWNDYKKFIKGLENAIANSHTELFKTEETKNKDEIITTLTKQEKVLKIKATFKEGKLQKTEVARESKDNKEIYTDNDAKGLLTTMNVFFEDAEVSREAFYEGGMKDPITVSDIKFKNKEKGEKNLQNEDYAKFIKNIQENTKNVKDLEFGSKNEVNNVTKIVLTGKAGEKSSLTIEVTNSGLDQGITAKSSSENEDNIAVTLQPATLVGKLNTFFNENNIVLSASIDKNKKGFGNIVFKNENKDVTEKIKKEQIQKAIEESTTKDKIKEYVNNLIENKVKSKNIKPENIKIEVKGEDVSDIKSKIKVGNYLKKENYKNAIEEAVKKAVESKYGKKVDEEIDKYNLVKTVFNDIFVKKAKEKGVDNVSSQEIARLFNKVFKDLEIKNLDLDFTVENFDSKKNKEATERYIKAVVTRNKEVEEQINKEIEHQNLYNSVRVTMSSEINMLYKPMNDDEIKQKTELKDLNSVRKIINITFTTKENKENDAQLTGKILCINYDEKEKKYKLTTDYNSSKGPVTLNFDKIEEWKELFLIKKQK